MSSLLPRLRRFALALTGSRDEGDDLVQATYERAIAHIGQWEAGTRLDSWMYRIMRNTHLNVLRGRKVRGVAVAPEDAEGALGVDTRPGLEARLTLAKVRRCIDRLPEDQKAILILVCVEGQTYDEAAATLELPLGTVTSRLARARTALRAMLESGPRAAPAAEPGAGR
jgi:RNA polymerase sigma-70 factor (ECF subfamily)